MAWRSDKQASIAQQAVQAMARGDVAALDQLKAQLSPSERAEMLDAIVEELADRTVTEIEAG